MPVALALQKTTPVHEVKYVPSALANVQKQSGVRPTVYFCAAATVAAEHFAISPVHARYLPFWHLSAICWPSGGGGDWSLHATGVTVGGVGELVGLGGVGGLVGLGGVGGVDSVGEVVSVGRVGSVGGVIGVAGVVSVGGVEEVVGGVVTLPLPPLQSCTHCPLAFRK